MRTALLISIAGIAGIAAGFAGGWFAASRPAPTIPEPVAQSTAPVLSPVAFADLPGWREDRMMEAFPALQASCGVFARKPATATIGEGALARPVQDWQKACAAIASASSDDALRTAIEANFNALAVATTDTDKKSGTGATGTFTGYYEAELNGSRTKDERHSVPIYGVPRDLVTVDLSAFVEKLPPAMPRQVVGRVSTGARGQALMPYFTRAEIDADKAVAESADVLVWVDDPVTAHILHIQGSGRVALTDGTTLRLSFAGHNGHRFKGIGSILLTAGVLKSATMDNVRTWLREHPAEAAAYMNQNARYIFFKLGAADGGPIGALGVPLTAQRSLAVDPRVVPLGAPLWLDTTDPDGKPFRRLIVAQDTGAAIRGVVRGDVFWGFGETAFATAARMKSPGRYMVLLPRNRG